MDHGLPCFLRGAVRFVVAMAVCAASADPVVADEQTKPGRLLFFGVAYDEGPPRGFDAGHFDYAPDNFVRLLTDQAGDLFKSIEVETLKGEQATHEQVLRELRKLKRQAHPDDLLFLYWGTHGGTGRDGWSAGLPGGGVIHGSEIKQELGAFPCQVVCIISTCGSGGFQADRADGVPLPDNVTAFCACRGQQSTTNELDRSLCEALAGFADADESGEVTLRETLDYVPKRYRKLFADTPADEGLLPVLAHSENANLDRPLTKVTGTYAAVVHEGTWYGVTVLESRRNRTKVRFLGFDSTTKGAGFSMPDAMVDNEMLDLPGGEPPADVEWNGTWYPARILSRSRDGWRIHYIGYPETDDETVPRNRVRGPFVDLTPAVE